MKRCTYCGREVEDQYQVCPIDQTRLVEPEAQASPAPTLRDSEGFFRWKPTSVILLTYTLVFAFLTVLCFFMAPALLKRGKPELVPVVRWGMVHFSAVSILCFDARRWIRRGSPVFRAAGALAVTFALLILVKSSITGMNANRNPHPVIEAVLEWLPLIYVLIYTFRPPQSTQSVKVAENAVMDEAKPQPQDPPSAS